VDRGRGPVFRLVPGTGLAGGVVAVLAFSVIGSMSGSMSGRGRGRPPRWRWVVPAVVAAAVLAAGVAMGPYEARKTLAALLMPSGLLWLGSGALAAALARRERRWAVWAAGALFLAVTVLGNGPLTALAAAAMEAPYPAIDPGFAGPFDAVVVLGGGLDVLPGCRPELAWTGERVTLGARLYLAGRTPLLVATGPEVPRGGRLCSIPEATRAYWENLGVPRDATLAVTGPASTLDEVRMLARLARERGWRRLGLVTSAVHMRRAMRLARRYGLEAVPLPADRLGLRRRLRPHDLVPSARGFLVATAVWWEVLGMAVGR